MPRVNMVNVVGVADRPAAGAARGIARRAAPRAVPTAVVLAIAAAALFVVATAGCTPSGPSGSQSAASLELVKNKCTMCHTIERINQVSKNRAGWEQTVTRMRGKGAVVTDAEAAQIVDYLSQAGAK